MDGGRQPADQVESPRVVKADSSADEIRTIAPATVAEDLIPVRDQIPLEPEDRGRVYAKVTAQPVALAVRNQDEDPDSVRRAMAGHDAVLAALGSPPWRNTAVRSEGPATS